MPRRTAASPGTTKRAGASTRRNCASPRIPRVWTVLALFVVMTTLYRNYGDAAGVASIVMIGFIVTTFAALQSIVAGVERSDPRVDFVPAARQSRSRPDHRDHETRAGSPPDANSEFVCRGVSYRYPGALTPVLATSIWRSRRTNAC